MEALKIITTGTAFLMLSVFTFILGCGGASNPYEDDYQRSSRFLDTNQARFGEFNITENSFRSGRPNDFTLAYETSKGFEIHSMARGVPNDFNPASFDPSRTPVCVYERSQVSLLANWGSCDRFRLVRGEGPIVQLIFPTSITTASRKGFYDICPTVTSGSSVSSDCVKARIFREDCGGLKENDDLRDPNSNRDANGRLINSRDRYEDFQLDTYLCEPTDDVRNRVNITRYDENRKIVEGSLEVICQERQMLTNRPNGRLEEDRKHFTATFKAPWMPTRKTCQDPTLTDPSQL